MENHTPSFLFGRRKGRSLRPSTQDIYEKALPLLTLTLPKQGPLDLTTLWSHQKPLHIEIGFGTGDHLHSQLLAHPEDNFIGCEPYLNGVASFLKKRTPYPSDLSRLKIYTHDGQSLLGSLPSECCAHLYVLFPDPWLKKKHMKRRFLNAATLSHISRILEKEGVFIFASDIEEYFQSILALCHSCETLLVESEGTLNNTTNPHQRPFGWPLTRFEKKAHREGRVCFYAKIKKIEGR